jgi:hypothetical protein
VRGESSQAERLAGGERAKRYREHAGRFLELAEMETQPRARERLLELALQYGDLAGHVSRRTTQSPAQRSPAARGRNG